MQKGFVPLLEAPNAAIRIKARSLDPKHPFEASVINNDCGNGFVFAEATAAALLATITRAAALWRDKLRFCALQQRGMRADYSWRQPAQATAAVYQGLVR